MLNFQPETLHGHLLERAPRILGFDAEAYFPEWQSAVRRTFKQLLGVMPAKGELNMRIEQTHEHEGVHGGFTELRLVFTSEMHVEVPCHLLLPKGIEKPPVVICLQGHTQGMRVSLGRAKPGEEHAVDDDYAVQCIKQGYAAFVMEQRCFGERAEQRRPGASWGGCHHATMTALLVGRTMAGERVWDVHRAVDLLIEKFSDKVDVGRIACMGNSGGGLIAYYAAAYDARIAAVMPSCCVCTFRASIGSVNHCVDNYLPNIMHYFDMQDIAGLILPRPMVVVSGMEDPLFPITGAEEAYADIAGMYEAQDAAKKVHLVVGPGGHRFYAALAWPAFKQVTGW